MTFFWCKFGFGKCFGASFQSSHWEGHHQLLYKVHFSLYITIQSRNGSLLLHRIREVTSKWQCFWFSVSSWGTHLLRFFHLSSLLQMLNDHKMVDIEFFGNFFVRGSALMMSTSHGQPLCSSLSRLLFPLQSFLNHLCAIHSLAVPGPEALLMLCYLHSFTIHFELKEENCSNLLFVWHHFPNLK